MSSLSFKIAGLAGCGVVLAFASAASAVNPIFTNQTAAAGVTTTHSTSGFNNSQYAGGGAVGDFNNDGYQDLFVISGGSGNVPDKLFINNGNGTFTDRAALWGLTTVHRGKGATVGDYDNDGWLDLYVTSSGPITAAAPGHHKLYHNNGGRSFTNVAAAAGVNFTNPTVEDGWGACFGDIDLDGDLDLIVGGSTSNNAGSKLFRNNGNGTFTNITGSLFTGVPGIFGFSPALADMNGDFFPDLLFVGDFGTSRYFKNNGNGTFTQWTSQSGSCQEENGMGQTRGDFDNDGKIDWYVTSIYEPPINWTGDKLYKNNGNHTYTQYAAAAGVNDGGYGWGTVAVDFNHDGWLDLAETNGDSTTGSIFWNEQSYLWVNNGNNTFTEMAIACGFNQIGKGRSMMNFDYDNDGDQDVIILANNEPIFLFRNDLNTLQAPNTNWLRVFLNTNQDPLVAPNGYGAMIRVTVGANTYTRTITGCNTYLGINELSGHFGLGGATLVNQLKVEWPDGQTTILNNVAVNQTITVSRNTSTPCPADLFPPGAGDGTIGPGDLGQLLSKWGPCAPPCAEDIAPVGAPDGTVGPADLAQLLSQWGQCR